MGEVTDEKMKLERRIKIGTTCPIIEAGSTTLSDEITAMSLRTLLHSRVNSSGEPLARSGVAETRGERKGDDEGERDTGVLFTSILKSKGIGIGIGGGLDEKPAKDLVFFPLGVDDGERGRLEPEDEVDMKGERKSRETRR